MRGSGLKHAVTLSCKQHIAEIDAADWDTLAGKQASLSHAFLAALEYSGSVAPGTGWTPHHLALANITGELRAAMPLYLKQHSWGEYVFDWAWANAYAQHGLEYYPKLVSAIPFTPIPGPRLLGVNAEARQELAYAVHDIAMDSGVSSLHLLFIDEDEAKWLANAGFMIRHGVQFHWVNRDYAHFDAFLASLNHSKRKKIRQDRRRAAAHELEYRWLDGHTATEEDWRFFYRCYATTYAQHRSTPYLTPDFFTVLARNAPDNVRLLVASRSEQRIACAFFLADEEALYGRYWGASEFLPCVHFELCYYRAIEYCIEHDLSRFEGGAQGEHKLSRGLEPAVTRSAHWLADERFADAVDRFLERERMGIDFYLDELSERTPFQRTGS